MKKYIARDRPTAYLKYFETLIVDFDSLDSFFVRNIPSKFSPKGYYDLYCNAYAKILARILYA